MSDWEVQLQLRNREEGLSYRCLAIQQQGSCHSHGTICHATERQSILVEKLFQLVINLSKINSDSQAHPESDLKKSDLILSNQSPWSPVWLAEKGGSPPSYKTMMNCSLTLKEILEHTKQPSAGIPVDCMIILLDTPLLLCFPNSLVRGHRSTKTGR